MIRKAATHYCIEGKLGAGGRGQVYRARDRRLGQDVVLNILAAATAHDPECMARLEREAQVLTSLNHTHTAKIYGLEESSQQRACSSLIATV